MRLEATPATVATMKIVSEAADIATPTGPMRTYLLRPNDAGKYPGIVLFSEIFQVTDPIRRIASLVAGHGYLVAVPEIYHEFEPTGHALGYDDQGKERGNELKTTKEISAFDSDARAAITMLSTHAACSGRLGALGVCLGGHLALRCAMNQEIRAAACFYATDIHSSTLGRGQRDNTLSRLTEIHGELLMIWGRQDPHIPTADRMKIYQAMNEANLWFTWHELNAEHAFMRDEGDRYDPSAARLCTQLMLDLFERKLKSG